MLAWALRNFILWGAISFACAYAWMHRDEIPALAGLTATPERPLAKVPAVAANLLAVKPDAMGQFYVDAAVDGAPVHFLVDTGASFVTLRLADVRAAGISPGSLSFTERSSTANGTVRFAPVRLREVRIGQLVIEDVDAAVIDSPLPVSLLGMSFLKRLDGYEIRDGALVLSW
jgi:aspartyl protease family protein